MEYDIFNGDGDGICALHQLRLAEPRPKSELLTGVKRDIVLLKRPELEKAEDCTLTVLDISLDSNRAPLSGLLARNNRVTYIDHHFAEPIPESDLLTSHIVFKADTCTSLIVNSLLSDRFAGWAICGAFGDNLHGPATQLAKKLSLSEKQVEQLREIGELLNYNGYGATLSDLHFHPRDLYRAVEPFADPFAFHRESPQLATLRLGFKSDMELALAAREHATPGKNRVYLFPDAPWARRVVRGVRQPQGPGKSGSGPRLDH